MSDPNVDLVFNGFLALSMKEKMHLVDLMNEFFDDIDRREDIRKANEGRVADLMGTSSALTCKCCRR